jgi:hypothetical protein
VADPDAHSADALHPVMEGGVVRVTGIGARRLLVSLLLTPRWHDLPMTEKAVRITGVRETKTMEKPEAVVVGSGRTELLHTGRGVPLTGQPGWRRIGCRSQSPEREFEFDNQASVMCNGVSIPSLCSYARRAGQARNSHIENGFQSPLLVKSSC